MRLVPVRRLGLALSILVAGTGCGADDGPSQSQLTLEKAPTKSGDQQTGPVGTTLGNDLRVLVTRDGVPANAVSVTWFTNEGSLDPTTSLTDPDGIASTSWTLGNTIGTKAVTVTVAGALGSPLAFTAEAIATVPPPSGDVTIEVLGPGGGNRFEPAALTVLVGTTVTWHWPAGSLQHNVVGDDGTTPAGSGALADGEHTYSFTFSTLGTYRYYCANHGGPNGAGMSGTITVTDVN
jgi:plastocyanin